MGTESKQRGVYCRSGWEGVHLTFGEPPLRVYPYLLYQLSSAPAFRYANEYVK